MESIFFPPGACSLYTLRNCPSDGGRHGKGMNDAESCRMISGSSGTVAMAKEGAG